jgi:IS4 transposase
LREVVVDRDDGKEPLRLITNDLEASAAEIAALYKRRWQIELFFKWIKQNLRIKAFFGRSENAVRMQLYTAIIAFLLLRLFTEKYATAYKAGIKYLMARLKVAWLDPLDLSDRQKPPPTSPTRRPPKQQLEIVFL